MGGIYVLLQTDPFYWRNSFDVDALLLCSSVQEKSIKTTCQEGIFPIFDYKLGNEYENQIYGDTNGDIQLSRITNWLLDDYESTEYQ